MNRAAAAASLSLAVLLAGCATARPPEPEPLITAEPANARVRLYANCVAASVQADTVERYGRYIRYLCAGPSAQALYDASAVHVRSRGLERVEGARITRGFSKRAWDDRCWLEAAAYGCSLTQPVGAFLDPTQDVAPPPKVRG